MDFGSKSSEFRKYYYGALENTVGNIEEIAETLHGDRIRERQNKRLKQLHLCLEKNVDGHEKVNQDCLVKFKEKDLVDIKTCLTAEKEQVLICANNAYHNYLSKENQIWESSKNAVDTCLGKFKEKVFKGCFAHLK